MPRIRFVNQYAGIIGGIERYMERTALLLRENGFAVDCCYAETARDSGRFLASFDHSETISEALTHPDDKYDLSVLHKVRDAAAVRAFRESGRTAVFIHDHEYYCPRKSYYRPFTRNNCSRSYCEFVCDFDVEDSFFTREFHSNIVFWEGHFDIHFDTRRGTD